MVCTRGLIGTLLYTCLIAKVFLLVLTLLLCGTKLDRRGMGLKVVLVCMVKAFSKNFIVKGLRNRGGFL